MFKISKTIIILVYFCFCTHVNSEIIKSIEIVGNERISDETILMFSDIQIDDKVDNENLNTILKNLYDTNFFDNVSVSVDKTILKIKVNESPIVDKIVYTGIKSKTMMDELSKILKLKSRSSFNDYDLSFDRNNILEYLKSRGYYFAEVETFVEQRDNKLININYDIELGKKAKIKKISFIGDTIYKNSKLRSLIISEEYRFWKFISGRKYLNQNTIKFDEKLIRNFYLNKGYYQVEVNSSFAKLIGNDEFELVFNINPNIKFFFNNLSLSIPDDFSEDNFSSLI